MDKTDISNISERKRALLRKPIIRLRKQGSGNTEIAELLWFSLATTICWWKRCQREDQSMLAEPKPARKHFKQRSLKPTQEKQIQKMIVDHCPEQLQFPFAFWDRQAIEPLILQQFGIIMPIRTVGHDLSRWDYTPQRPAEVARWMQEAYLAIKAKAKTENAESYRADESGIATNGNLVRGHASAEITQELRLNTRRKHIRMISAINNQGKFRFMLYENMMNSKRKIDFMKRLIKDDHRKDILILDNLKVHHSIPDKELPGKNAEKIEVFYLSSYSRELNSHEYLNNDLKQVMHGNYNGAARSKAAIHYKTISHMRHLQKSLRKEDNLFDHPYFRYAEN